MPRSLGRVAAAAAFVMASGCSSNSSESCRGTVSTVTQTGNTLDAKGSYNDGQPVLMLSQNGNSIRTVNASTTDDNDATFDITGLAKGVYTATWTMSCELGGSATVTSSVPTITIQ
jgi:hypothetical protein